ncbi:hypothetical protein [Nocardia suismassiliense]|uniref:hypothetical protein n=1 Tax=Nocardia suismassiliense TaxID=2077092 RepID=UPI000D1EF028|nr:hypothetical protein [Nocardia suismassiliense]
MDEPQRHPVTRAINTLINAMHPPTLRDGQWEEFPNRPLAKEINNATGATLSGNAVWKLRTGQTTNPTLETLETLRKYFGLKSLDPLTDPVLAEGIATELALVHRLRTADDTAVLELVLRDRLAHGEGVRPEVVAAMHDVLSRIEAEQRPHADDQI